MSAAYLNILAGNGKLSVPDSSPLRNVSFHTLPTSKPLSEYVSAGWAKPLAASSGSASPVNRDAVVPKRIRSMTLSLYASGLTKLIWYSPGWAQQAHAQTRHGSKSNVSIATEMKSRLAMKSDPPTSEPSQRDALFISHPLQPLLHSLRCAASSTSA